MYGILYGPQLQMCTLKRNVLAANRGNMDEAWLRRWLLRIDFLDNLYEDARLSCGGPRSKELYLTAISAVADEEHVGTMLQELLEAREQREANAADSSNSSDD
eukprot:TRINITY_DN12497_c0_g3_i2.p5 TRINITY_DN12497_c0_g3~~TRINITY_DN12497_c0_g3_i2.p5  ORF type:complete len:103 (+),score=29.31 TRINITY_DN12497_c0_g3_i2:522-830(+)